MCKKVGIAAVAVVLGLVVLGMTSTKVGSLLRLKWEKIHKHANNQVSPETEIERLRLVLKESEADDRRYEDQIARLALDVEKIETSVVKNEKALAELKSYITEMDAQLEQAGSTAKLVVFRNKERSRTDLEAQVNIDSRKYLNDQKALTAQKDLLRIKRETLAQSQQRLRELRSSREQALARLQQLENALLEERRAQVQSQALADDGKMAQFGKDLESLEDRIKLMQKRRELRPTPVGQGPIREAEAKEKGDAEVQAFRQSLRAPAPVANR
jgi:chromosome segregation ATPase